MTARIIKKYPNRRLYDEANSKYVNFGDLKNLLLTGENFKVIFDRTGEDQTGKESVLTSIDAATTIWDLNILREDLLGVEMPVYQAKEMGLLNENGTRILPVDYSKGF